MLSRLEMSAVFTHSFPAGSNAEMDTLSIRMTQTRIPGNVQVGKPTRISQSAEPTRFLITQVGLLVLNDFGLLGHWGVSGVVHMSSIPP